MTDPANTPWSIVDPRDPHHPMQKLEELMNMARNASLAVEDPVAYIRAQWDPRLPKMWEAMLETAVKMGDIDKTMETLTKMTAMSGVAPRSKVELSAGPEPDLSHLSDEEIARLRGVAVIEDKSEEEK